MAHNLRVFWGFQALLSRAWQSRNGAAGEETLAAHGLVAAAAPGGAELAGAAGGLGQRLGAGGAVAGLDDWGQVLEQPPDAVLVFRGVRLRVGPAAGEEFGEYGAQRSKLAAAGAREVEVVLHRPGGQDGGAGEVEADGVDPVVVGGVEQEVAEELPGARLGEAVTQLLRALLVLTNLEVNRGF